jgi:hypothetical protein
VATKVATGEEGPWVALKMRENDATALSHLVEAQLGEQEKRGNGGLWHALATALNGAVRTPPPEQ